MAPYCCPIWGVPLDTAPNDWEQSRYVYSPRAGGVYVLEGDWAEMARRSEPIGLLAKPHRARKRT